MEIRTPTFLGETRQQRQFFVSGFRLRGPLDWKEYQVKRYNREKFSLRSKSKTLSEAFIIPLAGPVEYP